MFVDIMMAFAVALLAECLQSINKAFKQIVVLVTCITIVCIYFINGCQINFAGEMDFAVWIIFVIFFDKMLTLGTRKLIKYFKNNEMEKNK